jgi:hypothetical protein
MTIEQKVLEKLRELPADKQQAVLEFVDSLKQNGGANKPLKNLRGLWADYGVEITEQDLAEAHRQSGRCDRVNGRPHPSNGGSRHARPHPCCQCRAPESTAGYS